MDDGYVEFEVVGQDKHNYIGERSNSRGANATAFDAAMVGKKDDGSNLLIVMEWKYTENYSGKCLYKPARAEIYEPIFKIRTLPLKLETLYPFTTGHTIS